VARDGLSRSGREYRSPGLACHGPRRAEGFTGSTQRGDCSAGDGQHPRNWTVGASAGAIDLG
jgi:hypothetical protein